MAYKRKGRTYKKGGKTYKKRGTKKSGGNQCSRQLGGRSRRKKGGAAGSATTFGQQVYGGPTEQHAQEGTNIIAANYIQNK